MNGTKGKPMTADDIYNEMQFTIGAAADLLDVIMGLFNEWPIPESEAERKRQSNACTVAFIAKEKAEKAHQLSMDFVDAEQAERAAA